MNKQKFSPIQVKKTMNFNGLTESNHLSKAYLTEPEKVGSVLAYAFGYQENNVLTLLTGGIGQTLYVTNREFEWDLHFQHERAIEVSESSTQTQAGIAGSIFDIVLAERIYSVTDHLLADDGVTQAYVTQEPYQVGNGWVYKCQLTNPNPAYFVKPELLEVGAKWSKDWSSVSEYSTTGGGAEYSTPVKLRNQLTTLRHEYKVSRNAAKEVMVIELYDPNDPSKKTRMWTKLAEWTNMAYWYRYVDKHSIYSTYNKNSEGYTTLKGEGGRPVYSGAGVREQISQSNKRYYSVLTYQILDEFLLDLSYAAKKWGGDHNFVALTGKMGMREFDRAMQGYVKGNNITITDHGTFIDGKGDKLEVTGYFSSVKFMNGISLTVKEFAPYDDVVRNRTKHPISGAPLESYRFTILNFGSKDGVANIRKVAMKDSEMVMWHVAGSTDPYGGVAKSISTMRSSPVDGYDVHILAECGIQIQDPTSCGELIMRLC